MVGLQVEVQIVDYNVLIFTSCFFYKLAKECVIVLCRSLMASGNEWLDTFLQYDFDDANNVDSSNGDDLNDDDWTDSECDSKEEEAEFNLVNPIVREMYAYMQ